MTLCIQNTKDPWLLMRLYTELKMEGIHSDDNWNELISPLHNVWMPAFVPLTTLVEKQKNGHCLRINEFRGINFHNHTEGSDQIIQLTEKNYASTLLFILTKFL